MDIQFDDFVQKGCSTADLNRTSLAVWVEDTKTPDHGILYALETNHCRLRTVALIHMAYTIPLGYSLCKAVSVNNIHGALQFLNIGVICP